jgi:dipeptidyl aminopeptidase/acylaminoacyl peptidase
MRRNVTMAVVTVCGLLGARTAYAADAGPEHAVTLSDLQRAQENLEHRLDEIAKAIDDLAWYERLGDIAFIDKWRITGPALAQVPNPKGPGAQNPLKFWVYSFVPRQRQAGEKLPLLMFPHGGVHANLTSSYAHIMRELLVQGYIVVAPDYRGSTGYGREFYEAIDYGGREVDDLHATREWAVENLDGVDGDRIGLVGWSHGGLMVLLEAAAHPQDYRCVFAGMPVSDLVMRFGYNDDSYRRDFTAPYHIGKSPQEDLEAYQRRSPAWHVDTLDLPVLIHTNTIDEDVRFVEVEHLAQALMAAGKKFDYRVFEKGPGGHHVDRIDTKLAREARRDIYRFLAKYLRPARAPK